MAKKTQADTAFTQASDEASELVIYEVGFHIIPSLSEAEVAAVVEKIRTAALAQGGTIISEGAAEKTRLSYVIERPIAGKREKFAASYFGWVKFEAPRAAAVELNKTLTDLYEVFRSIIVKTTREDIEFRRPSFVESAAAAAPIEIEAEAPASEAEEEVADIVDEKAPEAAPVTE